MNRNDYTLTIGGIMSALRYLTVLGCMLSLLTLAIFLLLQAFGVKWSVAISVCIVIDVAVVVAIEQISYTMDDGSGDSF